MHAQDWQQLGPYGAVLDAIFEPGRFAEHFGSHHTGGPCLSNGGRLA